MEYLTKLLIMVTLLEVKISKRQADLVLIMIEREAPIEEILEVLNPDPIPLNAESPAVE